MNSLTIQSVIIANQLLPETVKQLEKDFLMIGVNFDIEKPVKDYKKLFSFTNNLVNTINEKDPKLILNLLYRIDLIEEKIKTQIQKTKLSFSVMLSEMIVKRELYKVILRRNYF